MSATGPLFSTPPPRPTKRTTKKGKEVSEFFSPLSMTSLSWLLPSIFDPLVSYSSKHPFGQKFPFVSHHFTTSSLQMLHSLLTPYSFLPVAFSNVISRNGPMPSAAQQGSDLICVPCTLSLRPTEASVPFIAPLRPSAVN
jgi:hypothetical protein